MAPKKPKQPTMLQRQRALRKQQQQTKQQASKQLPPKGGTSANTRQARGQRTSTAKAQAANQQRIIARGMEGFVRRGQAQDKLDTAARGTQGSGTRTAGAGGGLAKRPSSAVTTRQSGKPTTTGGRVQQSSSGSTSSNRIQQVRVRDLGTTKPNQMSGSTPRALPPGRNGGALAKGAKGGALAKDAARVLNAAAKKGLGRVAGRVAVPLAIADTARDVFNPKDNILTRGAALGRSIERVVGSGGGGKLSPAERRARLDAKQGKYQGPTQTPEMVSKYKADRDARHKDQRDKMPPPQPKAPKPSGSPRPAAVTSGGGRGASATPPASRPASRPAARNIGPVADGDAYAREKDPKKFNPLMQKMFGYQTGDAPDQRAARNKTEGKGPVADGKAYAESLKINKKDKKRPKRRNEY